MLIFINQVINTPSQTDVIYFDVRLNKAFDTVYMSHSILLRKLWPQGRRNDFKSGGAKIILADYKMHAHFV